MLQDYFTPAGNQKKKSPSLHALGPVFSQDYSDMWRLSATWALQPSELLSESDPQRLSRQERPRTSHCAPSPDAAATQAPAGVLASPGFRLHE